MSRKLFVLILTSFLCVSAFSQKRLFLGGTANISYQTNFQFAIEPVIGYEFTDRWAIGSGIGVALVANSGGVETMGLAEPFVRFTAWHNELFFFDLKATAGFGFKKELLLAQIGIRPSFRFRINEHWDMSADVGLFGVTYDDKWRPAFGVGSTSACLWFAYRF